MSIRGSPDSPLASSLAKRVKTGHAGNSFFNDPFVKIEMEDGVNGQKTTWNFHRAPLLDQSKDFYNRLGDGGDTILLGDTSPETVDIFSYWLYTRSLHVAELRLVHPYDEDKNMDQTAVDNEGGNEAAEQGEGDVEGEDIVSHRGESSKSPPPVDWTGIVHRGQYRVPASSASSESATLQASPSPDHRDRDHDPAATATTRWTEVDDSTVADVAAGLAHPFDRVTVRLLDVYTFAQQYAVPALEHDVLALLKRHREAHRASRPRPSLDVLVYACYNNHFYAEDDPLWRWLAADFARTELCSPEAVDEMCRQLPPRFWQTALKAKVAADAAALETMAADMSDVAAERDGLQAAVKESQQLAASQAEQLANMMSQEAVDDEEIERLRAEAAQGAQEQQKLSTQLHLAYADAMDKLHDTRAEDARNLEYLTNQLADAHEELGRSQDLRSQLQAQMSQMVEEKMELQRQAIADAEEMEALHLQADMDSEELARLRALFGGDETDESEEA
ncbi:hypothetical protein PG991_000889 [Apiospora marii]|uniref:BTB domain-containing protein n=1 Tax=Apiospora marii TaxID=335849 RepID=A0ABR1STA1_9PEZI